MWFTSLEIINILRLLAGINRLKTFTYHLPSLCKKEFVGVSMLVFIALVKCLYHKSSQLLKDRGFYTLTSIHLI